MKRAFLLILITIAVATLVAGLVYALLLAAHVAEPAATTVHGATFRRLWATSAAVLALLASIAGGLALRRRTSNFSTASMRGGCVLAGILSACNGGLVLALAGGGPGSGNGVVGGAGAVVLGVLAAALGAVGFARSRDAG